MRALMQLVLSVLFLALTAAPARADLIIYDMFGAVGALNTDIDNPLICWASPKAILFTWSCTSTTTHPTCAGSPVRDSILFPLRRWS